MSVVINGSAGVITNSGAVYDSIQRATYQATTSGTAFNFTSIPSWVKRITVMFQGVSLSGTDSILVQLGDAGGIENTGYISTSTGFTGAAGSTVNNTTGFVITSDTASYLISGCMVITNLTGNVWVAVGNGKVSTGVSWVSAGDKTLSDTLTQLTVTRTGTNTFDAGSINILYE